jgi:hypothetical protein
MIGIGAICGKRSQQSVNTYKNPSELEEQQNKYILAERDIAFLSSQTGKYKYLF